MYSGSRWEPQDPTFFQVNFHPLAVGPFLNGTGLSLGLLHSGCSSVDVIRKGETMGAFMEGVFQSSVVDQRNEWINEDIE